MCMASWRAKRRRDVLEDKWLRTCHYYIPLLQHTTFGDLVDFLCGSRIAHSSAHSSAATTIAARNGSIQEGTHGLQMLGRRLAIMLDDIWVQERKNTGILVTTAERNLLFWMFASAKFTASLISHRHGGRAAVRHVPACERTKHRLRQWKTGSVAPDRLRGIPVQRLARGHGGAAGCLDDIAMESNMETV